MDAAAQVWPSEGVFCVLVGLFCVLVGLFCVLVALFCVSRSLLCVSRSLLCVSRSLLCVSRSLLCVSGSLLCVSRSLLCVSRSLLCVSRSLLCVMDAAAQVWPSESTHLKRLSSYCARMRLDIVNILQHWQNFLWHKKKKALMSASIAKSSSAKFSGSCGEEMLERRIYTVNIPGHWLIRICVKTKEEEMLKGGLHSKDLGHWLSRICVQKKIRDVG